MGDQELTYPLAIDGIWLYFLASPFSSPIELLYILYQSLLSFTKRIPKKDLVVTHHSVTLFDGASALEAGRAHNRKVVGQPFIIIPLSPQYAGE
jgi:hypothetical protein